MWTDKTALSSRACLRMSPGSVRGVAQPRRSPQSASAAGRHLSADLSKCSEIVLVGIPRCHLCFSPGRVSGVARASRSAHNASAAGRPMPSGGRRTRNGRSPSAMASNPAEEFAPAAAAAAGRLSMLLLSPVAPAPAAAWAAAIAADAAAGSGTSEIGSEPSCCVWPTCRPQGARLVRRRIHAGNAVHALSLLPSPLAGGQ